MKQINVNKITIGEFFKFNDKQRKFRVLKNIIELNNSHHKNHFLLIFDSCKQSILPKDAMIFICDHDWKITNSGYTRDCRKCGKCL